MSPELRNALLALARARRAYRAAYETQDAAGTLKDAEGCLAGEARRTALAYGDAEDVVREMAEAMLAEAEGRAA